jgi:hypothetical protein
MFTGRVLDARMVQNSINHPRNALNLQNDAHDSMDKNLAWGIEATFLDGRVSFFSLVAILNSRIR